MEQSSQKGVFTGETRHIIGGDSMKIITIYFHNCKQFKDYMFTRETLAFFKSIDDGVLNLQVVGDDVKMEYAIDDNMGITSEDLKMFCNILGSRKYTITIP